MQEDKTREEEKQGGLKREREREREREQAGVCQEGKLTAVVMDN